MSLKNAFEKKNVHAEIKLYISDQNNEWVDFTDRLSTRGKNKLISVGTVSHSTESQAGISNFVTKGLTVEMDNSDGFWDNISKWGTISGTQVSGGLITEEGNDAVWNVSLGGNEIYLKRRDVKIVIDAKDESGLIQRGVLGHFVIKEVNTATAEASASVVLESKSQILKTIDASKARDGKQWYLNRPTSFLVHELLKLEGNKFLDSNNEILDSFNIGNKFVIPAPYDGTGDRDQVISIYGRPPQEDSTGTWRDTNKIVRAIKWADTGSGQKLYFGVQDELWEWNPLADVYTYIGTVSTGYEIIEIANDSGTLHVLSVANLEYALNVAGQEHTYDGSTFGSVRTYSAINPLHFTIRRGNWDASSNVNRFTIGHFNFGQDTNGNNITYDAGNNIALPFNQYPKSINPSTTDRVTYSNRSGLTDDVIVNFERSSENINKNYYAFLNSAFETSINSISAPTFTVTNIIGGSGAYIAMVMRVYAESYDPENVLYTKEHTLDVAGANQITVDETNTGVYSITNTDGITLNSPKPLLIEFEVQLRNGSFDSLEIDYTLNGDQIGSSFDIPQFSIPAMSISASTESRDWHFLVGKNQDIQWMDDDSLTITYTNSNNTPADLSFSLGQFPTGAYNSSVGGFVTWSATHYASKPGTFYELRKVGSTTYIDHTDFLSDIETTDNFPIPLQPIAVYSDPASPEIIVSSVAWRDEANLYSAGYLHRISLDLNTISYHSTTLVNNESSGSTEIELTSGTTGVNQSDLLMIDRGGANEEVVTIQDITAGVITVTPLTNAHSAGESVEIIAQVIYDSQADAGNPYLITEINKTGTTLILSAIKRDEVNQGTMFKIGYIDETNDPFSNLFEDTGAEQFFASPSQFRGITINPDNSNEFYVINVDGSLWIGNISQNDFFYVGNTVDGDPNLSAKPEAIPENVIEVVDNLDRSLSPIFGISSPAYPDYTSIKDYTGKHYFWKLDQYITDRIELADFSGMSVWDALSKLALASNAIMGFDLDEDGNFFFIQKGDTLNKYRDIDVSSQDSTGIKINKNKGYDEIYNYVSVTPYYTKIDDPSFTYTYLPRVEEETLINEDDVLISTKSLQKANLKLVAVKSGNVTKKDTSGEIHAPLFKWKTYETIVEVRLKQQYDYTDTGSTDGFTNNRVLYLWSLFRGTIDFRDADGIPNIIDNAINIGDFVEISQTNDNGKIIKTEVKQIVEGNADSSYIVMDSALSFNIDQNDIIKIYRGNTDAGVGEVGWSDNISDIQTVGSSNGVMIVNNAVKINPHTVIETVTSNGTKTRYRVKRVEPRSDGNWDVYVYDNPNPATAISAGLDIHLYYSPYAVTYEAEDFVVPSEFIYQRIGQSKIGLKIEPSDYTNSEVIEGDILEVNYPGIILEKDEKSPQVAINSTSIEKFGKHQFPSVENRFLDRETARAYVYYILDEYKFPKYIFEVEMSLDPNLQFLSANGLLNSIGISDLKILPNTPAREGYIRAISNNPKGNKTIIQVKDKDPF